MNATDSLNAKIELAGLYENFAITKRSSLIGGILLSGIDPVGVDETRMWKIADLLKTVIQLLPENATLYQYYCHYRGVNISATLRDSDSVNTIVQNRATYLRNKNLSQSFIAHLIELPTPSNLNKFTDLGFIAQLLMTPFDKEARTYIKHALNARNAILMRRSEVESTAQRLQQEITNYKDKLGLVSFDNDVMPGDELWNFFRFLFTLDIGCLHSKSKAPNSQWDVLLGAGEIQNVTIGGTEFLKIQGAKTMYARVGSILGYGESHTPLNGFARGDKPAILCDGNYIIQQRWKPFSKVKQMSVLSGKRSDIHRKTIKFSDAMTGGEGGTEDEKLARLSETDREMLKELNEISSKSDRRMGLYTTRIIVFDENPMLITKTVEDLNLRLSSNSLHAVWETASIKAAFLATMPADKNTHPRHTKKRTEQVAALSHIYQTSSGQKRWKQTGIDEETLITLETTDGKPFGFNPFVGGKCVVIAVGPIRSGKSFVRATLASHNMKYGGYHVSIDVDAGTEPLVDWYSDISALFKISDDPNSGLNLLANARGYEDKPFFEHFFNQLESLIKLNSSDELRTFNLDEQEDLDKALKDLFKLPQERRTLSELILHLQTNAAKKLKRFEQGEMFGNFFDSNSDQTGSIKTRFSAFNLEAIKDNKKLLPIVQSELFFRANRLFEDPTIRHLPKILDIDEAHVLLQKDSASEEIVSVARRIGKYFGGIWLWSQNPEEYEKAKGWGALRTAASALIFMADSEMDVEAYKRTFKLNDGECERIARLTPKREFYLVQRDLGISTALALNVDPTQFVINASQAMEVQIRNDAVAKFPNDRKAATQHAAERMGLL